MDHNLRSRRTGNHVSMHMLLSCSSTSSTKDHPPTNASMHNSTYPHHNTPVGDTPYQRLSTTSETADQSSTQALTFPARPLWCSRRSTNPECARRSNYTPSAKPSNEGAFAPSHTDVRRRVPRLRKVAAPSSRDPGARALRSRDAKRRKRDPRHALGRVQIL